MQGNSACLEKEFFEFIYKRQLIWYKRFVLKEKPPWTDDEILKTYKIINVYRELDKCTLYLLNKLNGIGDRKKILINVIFYRFFNQYNLYENLDIEPFGNLNDEIKNRLVISFNKIKEKGLPIFNNAYLISSGQKGQKKHITILDNLQRLDTEKIIDEIDHCTIPEDSLKVIQRIPMVGPFLGCEIWTDLSYFKFFKQNWDDDDFVNIGPGAEWGLEIVYDRKLFRREQETKLEHLHQIQKSYLSNIHKELGEPLKWRDIAYKKAFSNYPFLSITNIEGALCEFRKYWNISHGKGKRRYFNPIS